MLSKETVTKLRKLAKGKCIFDDPTFCTCQIGGKKEINAYERGYQDGKILVARKIIESMGK